MKYDCLIHQLWTQTLSWAPDQKLLETFITFTQPNKLTTSEPTSNLSIQTSFLQHLKRQFICHKLISAHTHLLGWMASPGGGEMTSGKRSKHYFLFVERHSELVCLTFLVRAQVRREQKKTYELRVEPIRGRQAIFGTRVYGVFIGMFTRQFT